MWRIGGHVERFRELNSCVKFFAAHGGVIETFEVDHENFWESIDREIFFNVNLALTGWAFEACANHAFRFGKFLEAIAYTDTSKEADGFARDFQTQIHEIVEGSILVVTAKTGGAIDELAFEQVRHDRIIASFVVFVPLFWLLLNTQFIEFELFIGWFSWNTVQFIVHSIKQKAQEFLRVLLSVAWKLWGRPR